MKTALEVKTQLRILANPAKAKLLQSFFKTGPGEYGEGDTFLGVTVPETRKLAKQVYDLPFFEIKGLLKSNIHEERLIALLILVERFQREAETEQKRIVEYYVANTKYINNWDLVDLSAHKILGAYLLGRSRNILYTFAKSKNLWERRIAIISTLAFINTNDFTDTLKLAKLLLEDKHDLMHKAVGWMLREIGKRDQSAEQAFLDEHYQKMPRTMLRYAIERFPEKKRLHYMKK